VKTQFKESFARDLKRLKDRTVFGQVKAAIEQVEQAATLQEVSPPEASRGQRRQLLTHQNW